MLRYHACTTCASAVYDVTGSCRPGTTSEDVDAKGVANIAKAWAARQNGAGKKGERTERVSMRSSKDLERCELRL